MSSFSVNYASWVGSAPVEKSEPRERLFPGDSPFDREWVEVYGSLELTVGGVTRRVDGVMTESVWVDAVWVFRPVLPFLLKLDDDLEGADFVPAPLADFFSEGLEFEVSGELSADGSVFSPAEVEFPCLAGPSIEPLKAGCGSDAIVSLGYYASEYPALFRALRWA